MFLRKERGSNPHHPSVMVSNTILAGTDVRSIQLSYPSIVEHGVLHLRPAASSGILSAFAPSFFLVVSIRADLGVALEW